MARGRNVINQSIALEGGDEIVAQLRRMGEEGEAAARKLEAAFRNVSIGKSFGSAFANLKSSFASLQQAGSKVAESFGRVGASVANVSGAFQSSAARIGIFTAALTGAAVGAGTFIRGSLDSLGQLNDLSESLGIAAEDLQAFQYAGVQAGVGAGDFVKAIASLSDPLNELNTSKAADGFIRLGNSFTLAEESGIRVYRGIVSGSQTAGEETDTLSEKAQALQKVLARVGIPPGTKLVPADVLKAIADAFAGMEDGAEKTQLAIELLGPKLGPKLIPFLNQGGKAIESYKGILASFNALVTSEGVKAADAAGDQLAVIGFLFGQYRNVFTSLIAPGTHEVTASHVLTGEDGMLAFGEDVSAGSVRCSYSGAPQRKVVIAAEVRWTQYGFGTVPLSFPSIRSYTGDGLLSAWPKKGQRIGGGWTVASAFAKDAWSQLNTETINDRDGVTRYILYNWTISGHLDASYEAERSYREVATFTLQSDLQEIVTEAGDEEVIALSVSGNADEPVDPGGALPIGDLRRRAYLTTERGQQSVAYLANIAAARLLASARCVEISFEVPFPHAATLSLRKSASILDPRLPGGGAAGKIKSYSIFADGASGETGCRVTLGCTPGRGGTLVTAPGTAVYCDPDYVEGYQVYEGASQVLVTDGAGEAALSITAYDGILPNDDGLDLFAVTPLTTILETTITNPAAVQKNYIYASSQDTNAALTKYPTRIAVRYRPVKGGPFRTDYEIACSTLVVPKTIDLEAASA